MSMLLALMMAAPDALPAKAPKSKLETCIDASRGTNHDFVKCYGAALKRADTKLNMIWKQALTDVGGRESDGGKALVVEQRAWIAFKEKACNFYWTKDFGSMHRSIIGPSCALSIINARIDQLEDITSHFSAYRGDDA